MFPSLPDDGCALADLTSRSHASAANKSLRRRINDGLNANFACIACTLEKSAFVADEIERGDRNEDSGPEISG